MIRQATIASVPDSVRCPRCGYDQRGLPAGHRCPECGERCYPGAVLAEINQWVDRTLLNLWSICALQSVGGLCLVLGVVALAAGQPTGVIITIAAGFYVVAATAWFGATVLVAARRRMLPTFMNVTAARRKALRRWLAFDALLCALPPATIWLAGRG
ncbi:MAG TPA: hypothetical protein VGM03_02475 [Phycisphaerae bacterium]|jgi:hypothetical protein